MSKEAEKYIQMLEDETDPDNKVILELDIQRELGLDPKDVLGNGLSISFKKDSDRTTSRVKRNAYVEWYCFYGAVSKCYGATFCSCPRRRNFKKCSK